MRRWPQSSQPSIWPPSAAVRQFSIADITLSWARLTWGRHSPHASPVHECERYRRPQAMVAPGSTARVVAFHQQPEMLERTRHCPDRLGGDAGVERGRIQLGVAEQHLDNANIDILLEQVSGKAVPQGVRTDTLLDASGFRSLMDSPVDLARRNGFESVPSRKQPTLGQHHAAPLAFTPPEPQQFQ